MKKFITEQRALYCHIIFNSYCENNPIQYSDPYGNWVVALGVSWSVARGIGVNAFAYLLIDGNWSFGIYFGISLVYGYVKPSTPSFSFGILWKYKTIEKYLKSITGSYFIMGAGVVVDYPQYPSSKQRVVGIQFSIGSTSIGYETAPIDGGIYISLNKMFKKLFGKASAWKLLNSIRKIRVKAW